MAAFHVASSGYMTSDRSLYQQISNGTFSSFKTRLLCWFYNNQLRLPQVSRSDLVYCRRFSVTIVKADVHRMSVILATAASKLKYRTGGPEEQRRAMSVGPLSILCSVFESDQDACWARPVSG